MNEDHSGSTQAAQQTNIAHESIVTGAAGGTALGAAIALTIASTAISPIIGAVIGAASGGLLGNWANMVIQKRRSHLPYVVDTNKK